MKTIASGNGFSISSSFGDSVVEGTVPSGIEGVGAFLQFDIQQESITLRTVYIQVVPNSGQTGDFWDNFWSNYVDGEPADQFALSKFVSVEPSGSFGVYLNADTFSEGAETFSVNIYENNMDAARGYEPLLSANFTVLDDDGYTGSLAISGTAAEGSTLSLSDTIADADGLGSFSYQWLRDGSAISGETSLTYVLTQDDVGKNIAASVTYTDGYGTEETVTSEETSAIDYGLNIVSESSFDMSNHNNSYNLTLSGSGDFYGYGNDNNNFIIGNSGNNTLKGNNGNDTLEGGKGNDTLEGGYGNDTVRGGAGDDTIIAVGGSDTFDGGEGSDTLLEDNTGLDEFSVDLYFDLSTGKHGVVGKETGIDEVISIENYTIEEAFNVTLTGDGNANRFTANAGADVLYGFGGNDTLNGGAGNDTLDGGEGDDILDGGAGNDTLDGGDGDDIMSDGSGNDTLRGGAGKDTLEGGKGTDTLEGGKGTDTLEGGSGNDTLDGGNGNDTLEGGNGKDKLYGGSGKDTLDSGNGKDTLDGGKGNDTLDGGNGKDTLEGGKGKDKLSGNNGNDTLEGGKGKDILEGGKGKDIMFGGSSADTFVFTKTSDSKVKASKADVIKDFEQGKDHIDLHFIDASTKIGGNNAFTFDGTTSFGTSNEGDVYYETFNNSGTANDYTMVYIDTDNDRGTEMSIKLMGLHNLTADDFIL